MSAGASLIKCIHHLALSPPAGSGAGRGVHKMPGRHPPARFATSSESGFPASATISTSSKPHQDAIAFGDMAQERNTAGFFAADQHVFIEHVVGNMIEADRRFMHGQAVFCCQQVDHARGGNSAHHRTFQAAFFRQVVQRQRHDLVRVDKHAAFIHRADPVGIAIRRQADRALAHADRAGQRAEILGNRFRVHTAKTRIHLIADFMHFAAGAFQNAADHAAPCAIHGIDHYVLRIFGDDIEIDQFAQMLIIIWYRVEACDQPFFAGDVIIDQVGAAPLGFIIIQVHFHLSAQFRQRRTAVGGFQFDPVIARRVVGGGDHDAADRVHGV